MTGAVLSFIAFSELEKIKDEKEEQKNKGRKPKIKAYFIDNLDKEEQENYIDCSENHKIYIKDKLISIGKTVWVRIKVENIGNVAAKQCRAYLTKIRKYEYDDKELKTFKPDPNYVGGKQDFESAADNKFIVDELTEVSEFSNSMPLRWAYERRLEDYYMLGSGINFPSNSSYFADVFVMYNPRLNKPPDNPNGAKPWFLKLSTKPEAARHANLFSIKKTDYILYKFDIEVYADECEKSSLSIILEHYAKADEVRFSCLDKDNLIQQRDKKTAHYRQKLPEDIEIKIPNSLGTLDEIQEDIYDEL